jgi:DNA-directed RNA polymerase specialized sigma24 family protein
MQSESPDGRAGFATTHWSLIIAAGHPSRPDCRDSLAQLCQTYWFPLYAYARRRGVAEDEARDLTQSFFAELLENNTLSVADPQRGRFRGFLLTAFRNFMSNEWDKARAQKRGGGTLPWSLDFSSGESRYALEPVEQTTAERLFERQWVLSLLDQVLTRLRSEFVQQGRAELFEQLRPFITPQSAPPTYATICRSSGMTEGAAAVAVHRLRRRYRQLLRDEIAHTVSDPGDVDDEIRSLFQAFHT